VASAPEQEVRVTDSTSLATRTTVAELVAIYEQSAADIRRAYDLIGGAEERLNQAFSSKEWASVHLRARSGRVIEFGRIEDVIADLELTVWAHLVDRLELRSFLSIARAEQLDEMLEGKAGEDTFPPLTIDNVLGFATGFRSQIDDMLREAVSEVFEFLRPRNSEYKRNSEFEVPRRIVLEHMVERKWKGDGFHPDYYRAQRLTALQNVFGALDGRGSVAKTYRGELYDAIDATGPDGHFQTSYFRGRCFKNKNLHLEFTRLDLLARLNAIAGGKRLRSASEAA
jgi:hypothetical protein